MPAILYNFSSLLTTFLQSNNNNGPLHSVPILITEYSPSHARTRAPRQGTTRPSPMPSEYYLTIRPTASYNESADEDGVPNFYNDFTSTYNCKNKYRQPGSHPRFMVIGVHKGGSTALYNYLTKHGRIRPAVCKEIHFFDDDAQYSRGKAYYLKHFIDLSSFRGQVITGEGSPSYIRNPKAPERVYNMLPDAKERMRFLITLREPSVRFESHWIGAKQGGRMAFGCERTWNESLAELETCYSNQFALLGAERNASAMEMARQECETRLSENAIVRGIYASQIERWLAYFDASHFLVLQAEHLFRHTNTSMQRSAAFLNMRPYTLAELESFKEANEGSSHMSLPLALKCSAALKRRMDDFYLPHNARLRRLLEAKFPDTLEHWEPVWGGWEEEKLA